MGKATMKTARSGDPRSVFPISSAQSISDEISTLLQRLITGVFFASGAASLILQVIWFKQLQFVLGSTTLSVSVTVASFFFGLSVGSAFGGRAADAVTRPLRIYGFLELV